MKMLLTDMSVSKLKLSEQGQYAVWDAALPSFGVRVSTHSKSFVLKKNNRYHVLGRYPVITLKQARDEAKRRLALKYFPETGLQAKEAVRLFLEAKKATQRPKSHYLYSRALAHFPEKRLGSLTLADIRPVLAALPPSNANLTHAIFSAFLTWTVQNQYLDKNPLAGLKKPHKTTSRDRLLTDDEIRLIWRETYNHNSFGRLLRSLILSGQRLNQFQSFDPRSIKGGVIEFPATIMKGNAAMHLPISETLRANLSEGPLASRVGHPMKIFRAALPEMPRWTIHDTRRYFSSTMASLGTPIEVTERLLAHKTGSISQIAAIYNRHTYLPEMRAALEAYERHLLQVIGT